MLARILFIWRHKCGLLTVLTFQQIFSSPYLVPLCPTVSVSGPLCNNIERLEWMCMFILLVEIFCCNVVQNKCIIVLQWFFYSLIIFFKLSINLMENLNPLIYLDYVELHEYLLCINYSISYDDRFRTWPVLISKFFHSLVW